jgi:hypothetical protein
MPYDHFLITVFVFLDHRVKCFCRAATEQNDVTVYCFFLRRNASLLWRNPYYEREAVPTRVSLFTGSVLLPRKECWVRGGGGVYYTYVVVAFRSVTVVALRLAAVGRVDALEFGKFACEIYFSRSAHRMFVNCQHT